MTAWSSSRHMDIAHLQNFSGAPSDSYYQEWEKPSLGPHFDYIRAITPPPDMNALSAVARPYTYGQEADFKHNDHVTSQGVARQFNPADATYHSQHMSSNNRVSDLLSSPMRPAEPEFRDDASVSSKNGGNGSIAANLQIPASINSSGGSLSELAAQITCLFWFESSEVLQMIEDSPTPLTPQHPLVRDAKPTTGFRKWVTTTLSMTCVAQNVVLLALLFIHRLKKLNPTVKAKPGSEYRLLTVALMLGNKFLDDNTYTNKTWAEVSGINVGEVHLMEVEFLSNMRYHLYTSDQDWQHWQSLLGRFASFFDLASKLPQSTQMPSLSAPVAVARVPMSLPSPPSSTQASPPYMADHGAALVQYQTQIQTGTTPDPSPLHSMVTSTTGSTMTNQSRKRAREEHEPFAPVKRATYDSTSRAPSPPRYAPNFSHSDILNMASRMKLPALTIPPMPATPASVVAQYAQQLPPIQVHPQRVAAIGYPNSTAVTPVNPIPATFPAAYISSTSRTQSPYNTIATNISPTHSMAPGGGTFPSQSQHSPSRYLQQRSSPYRPVHNVSTLLYPPPSAAMQPRLRDVEVQHMRYQPLGKQQQAPHHGRLPYMAQNLYTDGELPHAMTPVHQWPGFADHRSQHGLLRH